MKSKYLVRFFLSIGLVTACSGSSSSSDGNPTATNGDGGPATPSGNASTSCTDVCKKSIGCAPSAGPQDRCESICAGFSEACKSCIMGVACNAPANACPACMNSQTCTGPGSPIGAACSIDSHCCTNNCTDNKCEGNGAGSACSIDSHCTSHNCTGNVCQP